MAIADAISAIIFSLRQMLDASVTLIRFSAFCAWVDIRNLFARTRLGTLWYAVGLCAIVAVLGIFFGTIFKNDLANYASYIPFLATGILTWAFLSSSINESCSVFATRAQSLRHTAQPFAGIPLTAVIKHLVIFVQNTILAATIYVVIFKSFPVAMVSFAVGTVLLSANVFWISFLGALTCVRFRDLPQLVSGLLHIAFFLTPIIWKEYFFGRYEYLVDFNPAYHLVSLVRLPLLGESPPLATWTIAVLMLIGGGGVTAFAYARTRHRIPYWL